ncbi:MAG: hypothetical protein ACI92S_000610, partial [Planctomycetaceae bacterium]
RFHQPRLTSHQLSAESDQVSTRSTESVAEDDHQFRILPVNLLDSVAIQAAELFCLLHNACRSSVGQALPDGVTLRQEGLLGNSCRGAGL